LSGIIWLFGAIHPAGTAGGGNRPMLMDPIRLFKGVGCARR
jgi:hypothetical protein